MPSRIAGRFLVHFVALGATAGSLGGFSSYAMWPTREAAAEAVTFAAALESQVPNRAVKADRIGAIVVKTAAAEGATYSLASLPPAREADRIQDQIRDAVAALPPAEKPQASWPPKAETKIAALPPPAEKPKRLLPPPPPASAQTSILDDGQIAGIRSRLRLTSDQAEYWPAVEAALREVAHKYFASSSAKHAHAKASIDTNAPEVQNLIYAAMPLLMRLREDQKNEVRKLARVIGLDSVASQI